jgi:ureidoacrylate peracid hydrolase
MVEGLSRQPGEPLIIKAGYGAFEGTPLDASLRNLGIKTVLLAGVATNICVELTARSTCDRGYYVVVLNL